MDNNQLPQNPITSPTSVPTTILLQTKKPPFKMALIILAGIILLSAVGFFAYQKFYPKPQPLPTPTPTPTPTPKITIPCPADTSFCQKAQEVKKDGQYEGLGANVPDGTPIYAPFDGALASSRSMLFSPDQHVEPFVQIILKANDPAIPQAVYLIHSKGGITKPSFKKGEIIATVSAKPLTYFGDYNLIFALSDKNGLYSKDRTEFIK